MAVRVTGRELIELGHGVKLLNARYVKAFVKGNKNDFNDVVSRPYVRIIAIKTEEQLAMQLKSRIYVSNLDDKSGLSKSGYSNKRKVKN